MIEPKRVITIEEELVDALVDKVIPRDYYNPEITFLHDHERHLLVEFLEPYEPDHPIRLEAMNNESYSIIELAKLAKKHLPNMEGVIYEH